MHGALDHAPITNRIRFLAQKLIPVSSGPTNIGQLSGRPELLPNWQLPPRETPTAANATRAVLQTTGIAVYRLGSDASHGVSALLTVRTPDLGHGGQVLLTLDIGLSVADGITLVAVAALLRDSILSLYNDLASALEFIVPPDAGPSRIELHWEAPSSCDNTNRPVPPYLGIDFTPLGESFGDRLPYGSYAELTTGLMTPQAASDLVVRALKKVAGDSAYLDPRIGLQDIQTALSNND